MQDAEDDDHDSMDGGQLGTRTARPLSLGTTRALSSPPCTNIISGMFYYPHPWNILLSTSLDSLFHLLPVPRSLVIQLSAFHPRSHPSPFYLPHNCKKELSRTYIKQVAFLSLLHPQNFLITCFGFSSPTEQNSESLPGAFKGQAPAGILAG